MDDLGNRFVKTMGLMLGFLLFIYFLIATSSEKPVGISLTIYLAVNWLFYWGIRILLLATLAVTTFSIFLCFYRNRLQEEEDRLKEERLRQQQAESEERRKEDEERKKMKEEKLKLQKKHEQHKEKRRQEEKELYLKSRSAEEANDAALKNFL